MTFADIQSEVGDRLGLLADGPAMSRIGRSINECYRRVASSLSLQDMVRVTVTANTVVGSRSLTVPLEKLFLVYDATTTPVRVLTECSFEDLRQTLGSTDPARRYAIQSVSASTIIIALDSVATTVYTLTADGEQSALTLSGTATPSFPADYHDLLVYGAMAIEVERQDKPDVAAKHDAKFEQRLSDLRFFLAKSATRSLRQGSAEIIGRPRRNLLV